MKTVNMNAPILAAIAMVALALGNEEGEKEPTTPIADENELLELLPTYENEKGGNFDMDMHDTLWSIGTTDFPIIDLSTVEGFKRMKGYILSAGEKGFKRGKEAGFNEGKPVGYEECYAEYYAQAFDDGYKEGFRQAKEDDCETGCDNGYKKGYEDGYSAGSIDARVEMAEARGEVVEVLVDGTPIVVSKHEAETMVEAELDMGTVDNVANPPHYQSKNGIECIEAIKSALTEEEFRGYCKGNVIKYTWRERMKGGDESLRKASWYIAEAVGDDYQ